VSLVKNVVHDSILINLDVHRRRFGYNNAAKPHPRFQRVEENAFDLVFLFVHKKRIALTSRHCHDSN
jgi:hypothetical protein